jgi:hypothetical protein
VPFLYLKLGFMLSDLTLPDQGNLQVIPGSHKQERRPFSPAEIAPPHDNDLPEGDAAASGAIQLCGKAGSCVLFHNALWHGSGPFMRAGGRRVMHYNVYEHPWMQGGTEQWSYPSAFMNDTLSHAEKHFFNTYAFDPPFVEGETDGNVTARLRREEEERGTKPQGDEG